jgi:hypothetical protein
MPTTTSIPFAVASPHITGHKQLRSVILKAESGLWHDLQELETLRYISVRLQTPPVRKGSLTGHIECDNPGMEKDPPSPRKKLLAEILNKMVRFIFSNRGLIRTK